MIQKANEVRVVKCGCGRVALAFLNEEDRMYASCEFDPVDWLRICTKIVEVNQDILESGEVVGIGEHDA